MLKKKQMHEYQTRLVEKAKHIPNIGLFMECGLGKTVTALTIISEHLDKPTLIVAPKRIAQTVWAEECKNWEHLCHIKVGKILGSPKSRLEALRSSSDIYVTNLENIVWLLEQPEAKKFRYLILDESSRWKDPSTKRFKALKKYLKQFDRKILLSGTPSPQSLSDLWSQVGILDLGQRLETSLTKFRAMYMDPGQRNRHTGVVYNWVLKQGADKIIKQKISDICFSLKAEDYLQLPDLTKLYHKIELDSEIKVKYNEIKKSCVLQIGDSEITAATAASLTNKLLQFTSGAIYDEEGEWHEVHKAKLEYLESLLEECSSPTLVFYHFKHSLKRIQEAFPQAHVLDDSNIQAWRDGKIRLLLAHPQSGGIGINLQCNAGDTAQTVWYDLPWSSENYIQANARIYRQGQEKPVIIHHLCIERTIDEQVVNVLEGKINLQDALMNDLKFALI